MRIAISSDAWHPQINGVVTTLTRTINELENRGHQILTITPDQCTTIPCPSYPEIRLALRPRAIVARCLREFIADAIHIATEGPIGLATRAYCVQQQVAFTTSLHTRFPEYLRLRLPIPLSWGYGYLRWFHRPAWRILVAVPSFKKELEAHGLSRMATWSRGVDLNLFRPYDKHFLQAERPIFMYMGRVAVEKNVEDFLKLDLPGTKYVIGDGPDLQVLRKHYPKVVFTGYKVGFELAYHLASADVFVFPSKTDTFGLTILEAMGCGVPVAAYPVQGPIDLIIDGENGFVDGDLRAAALKCLSVDGEKCRQSAMGYSWQASTTQFLGHLCVN